MANKAVFSSSKAGKAADTKNAAGGTAYKMSDRSALAQMAVTGTFSNTFYVKAEDQLAQILVLAKKVDAEFVARTAIYSRQHGYMKDMPAFLLAVLAARGEIGLLRQAWPLVIDNGRMVRNFVQIIRSGVTGRKSLGSAAKKMIQRWLNDSNVNYLFNQSVGNSPSLRDVIRLTHPNPVTSERQAFFGYVVGAEEKHYHREDLPKVVQQYEAFKRDLSREVPNVETRLLTSLPLTDAHWKQIASKAKWQETRMNLNAFNKHEVFSNKAMVTQIADKLRDADSIRKARAFPYQLLMAYTAATEVPTKIREALQDAMEIAIENVPVIPGNVVVCPDVSGSMGCSVTGHYGGRHTSAVRCVDAAALFASAILRRNPEARVIPFAHVLYPKLKLNPRDTVMTNTSVLTSVCGGGTNCSLPLVQLNSEKAEVDLIVYISDNESWLGGSDYWRDHTKTLSEWKKLQKRNPNAKMVCIDITANDSSQAPDDDSILNIGGFSDAVFKLLANFVTFGAQTGHWVGEIERATNAHFA